MQERPRAPTLAVAAVTVGELLETWRRRGGTAMPAGVRHNASLDPLDTRVNRPADAPVPHDGAGLDALACAFGIEPARLKRR